MGAGMPFATAAIGSTPSVESINNDFVEEGSGYGGDLRAFSSPELGPPEVAELDRCLVDEAIMSVCCYQFD